MQPSAGIGPLSAGLAEMMFQTLSEGPKGLAPAALVEQGILKVSDALSVARILFDTQLRDHPISGSIGVWRSGAVPSVSNATNKHHDAA